MELHKGTTRYCILTSKYAIKIPSLYSWELFLTGLLCNMQEVQWNTLDPLLCPVLFKLPLGFLLVMPKVRILEERLSNSEFSVLISRKDILLPIENKRNSFGYLSTGELVAIDYGT